MSNFFSLQFDPKRTFRITGIIVVPVVGLLGFLFYQTVFNDVNYTTTYYTELLIQEWIPEARPVFYFLVPAFFLSLLLAFPRTSRKRLALIVMIVGIILTLPVYFYNLMRWRPVLEIINSLPVLNVVYHRHTKYFGGRHASMDILFLIPQESDKQTERTIDVRLSTNNEWIRGYRLELGGHPLMATFSIYEQTPQGTKAAIYVESETP